MGTARRAAVRGGIERRRLVFLFGAGASYGAGDIIPEPPPLGKDLYQTLAAEFPGSWGGLPKALRREFMSDFERGMAILYAHYSMAVSRLMRELAAYLVQFRPHSGRSLYCELLRKLQSLSLLDSTVLSSLNYDCALDFSMARQALVPDYFGVRAGGDATPLWKLHGSCNMFCSNLQVGLGVQFSAGIDFEGGIEATLDPGDVIRRCLTQALPPAMCLYMEGKPLHVSPSVIKQVQAMWAGAVSRADAVFCIGVAPHPPDRHVWGPLAATIGTLHYIGEARAFRTWAQDYRTGPTEYIAPYFHTGFDALVERVANNAGRDQRSPTAER